MTRAESQANLAYPEDIIDASPLAAYPNWIDRNLPFREGFVDGYKQAEKDRALTWEDIKTIEQIIATSDWYDFEINGKLWSKEFYEEVLKRFNEAKK